MDGRERGQAAQRLLALASRRDRPPAPRLVRADDDVDEPLEEVTLVGLRGAPRQLERLVRVEPFARTRERQPALVLARDGAMVAGRHGDDPAVWGRPLHPREAGGPPAGAPVRDDG